MSPRGGLRLARIMVAGVVVLLVSAGLAVGYSETQAQSIAGKDGGVLTFTFDDLPRPASDEAEIVVGFKGNFLWYRDDQYADVYVDGEYVGHNWGTESQCEYHEASFQFSSSLVADGTVTVDVALGPGVTYFGCPDEVSVTLHYDALPQCADGIDNDGDGYVDYADDPGCTSSSDNTEAEIIPTPEHVRWDLRPGCEGADTLCYDLGATILYQGDQYGALREGTLDAGVLPRTVANVPDGGATLGPDGDGDGVPAYVKVETTSHTVNKDGSRSTRAGPPIVQTVDPDDTNATSPIPPPPDWGTPPPDQYETVVLLDETLPLTSNGTETPRLEFPLARVTGAPRDGQPNQYELSGTVLGTSVEPVFITTLGVVSEPMELTLLKLDPVVLDAPDAVAHVRLEYVHDAGKNACIAGYGSVCAAPVPTPLEDPTWFPLEGEAAVLVLDVRVEGEDGATILHESVTVPFAGQVLGASGAGAASTSGSDPQGATS